MNRGKAWAARLKRRYGITVAQYRAIWKRQGGKCPICHKRLTASAHVEHNHKLKGPESVRGLVCGYYCNYRILGALERIRPVWVERALAYLAKNGWGR